MNTAILVTLAAASLLPTGATREPSGHWTIQSAPPAPFTPSVPESPPPKTAEQQAAETRFWDYAKWQGRVLGNAATVHNFLKRTEKGNYVDMRFEGVETGQFRVVYSFLRDGPATLAKYRVPSDFMAETVPWSEVDQKAALEVMRDFLRREQISWWGGTGGVNHRAEVRLPLTRPEWEALVAKRRFKVPAPVLLTFAERSAAELNQPLPPDLARGIRLFARADAPSGPVPSVARTGKIVLRNGCFRTADPVNGNGHVLFPLGQRLFIDSAGYLAFGAGATPDYARVGEEVEVDGTFAPVIGTETVAPIVKACGPGKVYAITAPRSAAAAGA